MALYVAICLIAALTALESVTAVPGHILGLVWGTTVGLALAHVFAFRVAGRLVHDGELPKADRITSVVQLAPLRRLQLLSASRFCWPQPKPNSTGPVISAPASSVRSATSPLAAPSTGGYALCSSASVSSQLPSSSQCSNTGWPVTKQHLLQRR
jgi:hypothetical protein